MIPGAHQFISRGNDVSGDVVFFCNVVIYISPLRHCCSLFAFPSFSFIILAYASPFCFFLKIVATCAYNFHLNCPCSSKLAIRFLPLQQKVSLYVK
jgi:hypothetical protein